MVTSMLVSSGVRRIASGTRSNGVAERTAAMSLNGARSYPHHVGDRVEDVDLQELRRESGMVRAHFVRRFLEGDQQRVFPVPYPGAQELQPERRLSGARRSDDEVGPPRHEPAVEHGIEAGVAGRNARFPTGGSCARCGHGDQPPGGLVGALGGRENAGPTS